MASPLDTYSLAHVALPFRPDDRVYEATPPAHWDFVFLDKIDSSASAASWSCPRRLRAIAPQPFFPYVESRIGEFLAARER